jgi:hypothetical protein
VGLSKWGYLNDKGETVIPFAYDISGNEKIGAEYYTAEMLYLCHEGYIPVRQGEKWGIYNKNGEPVVPMQYEGISQVNDGKCFVKMDGKWGLLEVSELLNK